VALSDLSALIEDKRQSAFFRGAQCSGTVCFRHDGGATQGHARGGFSQNAARFRSCDTSAAVQMTTPATADRTAIPGGRQTDIKARHCTDGTLNQLTELVDGANCRENLRRQTSSSEQSSLLWQGDGQ
jgi:hypothetical protein